MKASKLVSILLETILTKGDGDVEFEMFYNDRHEIYDVEVLEDEDVNGNVTKRTFVLKD